MCSIVLVLILINLVYILNAFQLNNLLCYSKGQNPSGMTFKQLHNDQGVTSICQI